VIAFITRRLLLGVVTMWLISVASFTIIQLPPGDFVDTYIAMLAASGSPVSAEAAQAMRREYGLDRPYYVQYAKWVARIASGNMGESMEWRRPVTQVIGDRLWLTLLISAGALVITWGLALPIGILSAVRQYSVADYIFTFVGFIGIAVPNFLLALIVLYLAFRLFGLSVGGLFSADYALAPWSWAKVKDLLWHLPVPVVILALAGTAQLIRIMRANLLDELRRPYVVTARAKGLSEWRTILKYPVRAALNPFASNMAYLFPALVSSSVIISIVLGLPTVGPLLVEALIAKDMYLAGAIVLLLGGLTVIGTFISDMVLMWVDPRLRHQMD
jgi:peptide/nickel transport system permease protein